MRLQLAAALAACLLTACGSGPPPAAWRTDASSALDQYRGAWLRGDSRLASQAFARARAELAATGQAEMLARAELTRCALQVASLDFDDCPGFARLARDAERGSRAYAAYLAGRWSEVDPALLAAPHRAVFVAAGGGAEGGIEVGAGAGAEAGVGAGVLAAIGDPHSRLVAAGALFRVGRLAPSGLSVAIETSSANGWRRPLLAWLGVQQRRAAAAGDTEAAEAIGRRIGLVLESAR